MTTQELSAIAQGRAPEPTFEESWAAIKAEQDGQFDRQFAQARQAVRSDDQT